MRNSGLSRSSTSPLQPEHVSRRKSTGLVTAKTFDAANRPRSMVYRGDMSPLTPATAPEIPGGHTASKYDLASPDTQRTLGASPGIIQGTSPVLSPMQPEEPSEASSNGSHQQLTRDALLSRAQSEVSLYAPSRRRSAILTPGVATRSEQSDVSPSTKLNPRNSVPNILDEPAMNPAESPPKPRRSFPKQLSSDTPERVPTPSEADYRHIGGIKFGSLRVMNASPGPSPGPEQRSKTTTQSSANVARNLMSSGAEGQAINDSTPSIGEIKQPKPLSGAVSPVMATFSDASANGVAPSTDCSPFSPPTGVWKSDGVSPLTPATQPSSKGTPEIPDIHQKPDTKPSAMTNTYDDKRKSTTGATRSNSGPGSSSSSEGRQESVSKMDSGYSSSRSIKSLFGSKKSAKQTKDGDAAQPVPTPGESQEKHPGGGLLGSFKARKSREQTQQPGHSRGASAPNVSSRDVSVEKPTSSSGASTSSQKSKKLQKLVTSARRRSLPNMPPSQPQQEDVPSMPSDAAEKLQEHNRMFDEESKQSSFRVHVPKEAPKSIVAVESKEVPERPPERPYPQARMAAIDRPPRPKSTGPIHMGRAPSVSSTKPPAQRKSILRRSKHFETSNFDDDDGVPDYILGYEVQAASIDSIRRSAGNSAFDAAFVPMAEDNAMGTAMKRMPPPGPVPRTLGGSGPYPPLRTRSSAPDFLETVSEPASPGSVDCYSQKMPKTPPPISIRTRGSKKKKRSRAPHSASHGARHHPPQHPPMPDPHVYDGRRGNSTNEQDLTQSLRSFPVLRAPGDMSPKRFGGPGKRPEHGMVPVRRMSAKAFYLSPTPRSESETGRYPAHPGAPPQAYGPPHGPGNDDPTRPPYRVLHSYNSPSYKSVPIRS